MRITTYHRIRSCADDMVEGFRLRKFTKYRVATKVWKYILLNNKDEFSRDRFVIKLVAKSIGAGVYEITEMEGKNEYEN